MLAPLKSCWAEELQHELQAEYMHKLEAFLSARKTAGAVIYPEQNLFFNALNTTAFKDVKVVILGQDPYHGPMQAHGLSFSVQKGVKVPPSLKNIYKELLDDPEVDFEIPDSGDLTAWAQQGVLLLNAVLSVEAAEAGSHAKKGWEKFTDAIIKKLSDEQEHLVFLLWGSYAQKKGAVIDQSKHLVLNAVHPSPLSAHRGFIGCRHFSQANRYLKAHSKEPIKWKLAD